MFRCLNTQRSLTIIAWIKNTGSKGQILKYKKIGRGVTFWMDGPRTLAVRFSKRIRSRRTPVLKTRSVRRNKWQLVAATYEYRKGIARLFVQGRFVRKLKIGSFLLATKDNIRVGRFFRGSMSCLQIYNKPLTACQIRRRAKMCWSGKCFRWFSPGYMKAQRTCFVS